MEFNIKYFSDLTQKYNKDFYKNFKKDFSKQLIPGLEEGTLAILAAPSGTGKTRIPATPHYIRCQNVLKAQFCP